MAGGGNKRYSRTNSNGNITKLPERGPGNTVLSMKKATKIYELLKTPQFSSIKY